MEYQKNKPIRLKGKKLADLYAAAFERDDWTCQGENCPGTFQIDRAPHHKTFKSRGGEDTMENLVTLCIQCHGKTHGLNIK